MESSGLRRIIGVYDADHTLRGELSYFVKARLGKAHCALCDVTHGLVREKSAWRHCAAELPAPFVTFHRDDQPPEVHAAAEGRVPVVVAEMEVGYLLLLDPDDIEACGGSPEALGTAIARAIASLQSQP